MTVAVAHDPRQVVLRRLAVAYDHFAEEEQHLVGKGRYKAAEAMHRDYVLPTLRAYQAEMDDPSPKPPCGCLECCRAYSAGGR